MLFYYLKLPGSPEETQTGSDHCRDCVYACQLLGPLGTGIINLLGPSLHRGLGRRATFVSFPQ